MKFHVSFMFVTIVVATVSITWSTIPNGGDLSIDDTRAPTLAPTRIPTTPAPTGTTVFQFTQQAELVGADEVVDDYVYYDYQGTSVTLSGNGTVLVVGGPGDEDSGSIWTFQRLSNQTWQQIGDKFKPADIDTGDNFGSGVSLSLDGSLLAVGAIYKGNTDVGGAYIFEQSGSTWTPIATLVGTGATDNALQGYSVSLSADGTTVAVGGVADNNYVGATWVFTRAPNGTWVQQGEKLLGIGVVGTSRQGSSVSLSADGNTLAVGADDDNLSLGATCVFVRAPNGTWTQQGPKLVGTGVVDGVSSRQGRSVSLSWDGNTLAVGGSLDDDSLGATWIFTRALNGTWIQQGEKLVGANAIGSAYQGYSVSLSGDGDTVVAGGTGDDINIGATWIFKRALNGVWSQFGDKLVGNTTVQGAQGSAVALASATVDVIVVGAPDTGSSGSVWVFTT